MNKDDSTTTPSPYLVCHCTIPAWQGIEACKSCPNYATFHRLDPQAEIRIFTTTKVEDIPKASPGSPGHLLTDKAGGVTLGEQPFGGLVTATYTGVDTNGCNEPGEKKSKGCAATHYLKTREGMFQAVVSGVKQFEFRINDRAFQTGDTVVLQEIDSLGITTRLEIAARISYVLPVQAVTKSDLNYVILQLKDISKVYFK